MEKCSSSSSPLSVSNVSMTPTSSSCHGQINMVSVNSDARSTSLADSQHTDSVVKVLRWALPLVAVIAYAFDSVWILLEYDPKSEEQHNYAGLTSTILILFYYLQFDVKIDRARGYYYIIYQTFLFLLVATGDIVYAVYYGYFRDDKGLMIIFITYSVIDPGFVICIGYLKYKRKLEPIMEIGKEALFHLMSRIEVLLIILIPLYSTYDVISTNSIAFFILYDLFTHLYNHELLIHRKWSRLSFWLLVVFATLTVIFENVEFIFDHRAQEAHEDHDPMHETKYRFIASTFKYINNGTELVASIACYALILMQFLKKLNPPNEAVSINANTAV